MHINSPSPLGRLFVYSTLSETFVIGSGRCSDEEDAHADSRGEETYRVLRIAHSHAPHHLHASEYPITYDNPQINRLIQQIHIGNHVSGGSTFISNAITILGCIRFVSHYYLLLMTKKALVGVIRGSKIYRIADIALIPLSNRAPPHTPSHLSQQEAQAQAQAEKRYRRILLGLDLTRSFFFTLSSYDLTASMQVNMGAQASTLSPWESPFVWNTFISMPLRASVARSSSSHDPSTYSLSVDCRWTVPVIHGSIEQRRLSVLGRTLTLTLVSRRSRHFAGTRHDITNLLKRQTSNLKPPYHPRYKKRGLNDKGQVANEVETEQMVDAGWHYKGLSPLVSSFVQVRGSIPLSWSQQTSPLSPKPDVVLYHFDPNYDYTRMHFQDLIKRYCPPLHGCSNTADASLDQGGVKKGPVICLNLVKSKERRPRETLLRSEYNVACLVYNEMVAAEDKVVYVPWDFAKHAKMAHASGSNVLLEMEPITRLTLDATGIFVSHVPLGGEPGPSSHQQQRIQSGVLRTCCIDCLDRTNVAQFALGLSGLDRQLKALGVIPDSSSIDADSSISLALMNMYENMGNEIALQYGGSAAHSVIFDRKKGEWEAAAQGKDMLTSLKRFYNNSYTDAEKQDAINLFLGFFVPGPSPGRGDDIWDLEHDLYLHTGLNPRDTLGTPSGPNPPPPTSGPNPSPPTPITSSVDGDQRHGAHSSQSSGAMKATPHPMEASRTNPHPMEASRTNPLGTPEHTNATVSPLPSPSSSPSRAACGSTLNPFMSSALTPLKIGGGLGINSSWPPPISPRGGSRGSQRMPASPSHTPTGHSIYYPSSDEEDASLVPTSSLKPSHPSPPQQAPAPPPATSPDLSDQMSSSWASVFSIFSAALTGGPPLSAAPSTQSHLGSMLPISYGHTYSSSASSSAAARSLRRAARESRLVAFDPVMSCPPLRPQPVRLYKEEEEAHGGLLHSLTSLIWSGVGGQGSNKAIGGKRGGKAVAPSALDDKDDEDWIRVVSTGPKGKETSLAQFASPINSPPRLNSLVKRSQGHEGDKAPRWIPSEASDLGPCASREELLSLVALLLLPQSSQDPEDGSHDRLDSQIGTCAVGGSSVGVVHSSLPPSLILSLRPKIGRRMTLYTKRMAPASSRGSMISDISLEPLPSSPLRPSVTLARASQVSPTGVNSKPPLASLTSLERRREKMEAVKADAWAGLFAPLDPEGVVESSASVEGLMDRTLDHDGSDLGLTWEQRPGFFKAQGSHAYGREGGLGGEMAMEEAYLTCEVASANARADYEDYVASLGLSGCVPDASLLDWYRRHVDSPRRDLIDPVAARLSFQFISSV